MTPYLVNTKGRTIAISINNPTGRNCTKHLSQDVANTSEQTNLAADQQAQSHCWVQVGPTDVPQTLSQCGDRQCEG